MQQAALAGGGNVIDPRTKMLLFNPKVEDMFRPMVRRVVARGRLRVVFCLYFFFFCTPHQPWHGAAPRPQAGPQHPNAFVEQKKLKNTFTGFVESGEVNDFTFEDERRTFLRLGYAHNPSVATGTSEAEFVGDAARAAAMGGETLSTQKRGLHAEKRVREAAGAADDVAGFKGPWARYEEEALFAQEVEEAEGPLNLWTRKDIDAPAAKKTRGEPETSTLHSAWG